MRCYSVLSRNTLLIHANWKHLLNEANRTQEDKYCVILLLWKWKSLSHVSLFATPWTVLQARILSLLQGIFPTQGLNPGLLHCRWILYQLSYQGSPSAYMSYLEWANWSKLQVECWLSLAVERSGGGHCRVGTEFLLRMTKKSWLSWVAVVVAQHCECTECHWIYPLTNG